MITKILRTCIFVELEQGINQGIPTPDGIGPGLYVHTKQMVYLCIHPDRLSDHINTKSVIKSENKCVTYSRVMNSSVCSSFHREADRINYKHEFETNIIVRRKLIQKHVPPTQPFLWEGTYIVAPGEDWAPLRRDTCPCVAVDARPRLIDVTCDNRWTVWWSGRSRRLWTKQICEYVFGCCRNKTTQSMLRHYKYL